MSLETRLADFATRVAAEFNSLSLGGDAAVTQTFLAEESGPVSPSTASGFQWSYGNGDETPQNEGMIALFNGVIRKFGLTIEGGAATVEIYVNGVASGVAISTVNEKVVSDVAIAINQGDLINFRTTAASGTIDSGRVVAIATGSQPTEGEVIAAGATNGQIPVYNSLTGEYEPADFSGGGTDEAAVAAIAAGSTLGLQQELLANAGQPGLTVLAVGFTDTGKVQGVSLGDGNVVEVYASGADFNTGTVLYREFMSLGEPICFTGLSNGAIITATEGFYGFSEQLNGSNESPMPLLSYGLSFRETFFFAFRDSNDDSNNRGFIRVVNGPLASSVTLTRGNGDPVNADAGSGAEQTDIPLEPWQFATLQADGNTEFIIRATNPIMACVHAEMRVSGPRYHDSRLIMPLTNDGITWPRSGQVSAPYNNTQVAWFTRDNVEGFLNSPNGVSPGSPVDFDAGPPVGTGASDQDYEPDGATRVLATGLISAYSGADSAGLEASPLMPTKAMSQVVAQPLFIADNGDGGNSGVAIASPYEGTARVYEWNSTTSSLDLVYTVNLTRNGVTVLSKEDQKHPAAGLISNDSQATNTLVGQLNAGVIIADVPITVVVQNGDSNLIPSLRSQNGTTTTSIVNDDDETLSLGITPESIAAEIREGTDGVLYRRSIGATGTETWVQA